MKLNKSALSLAFCLLCGAANIAPATAAAAGANTFQREAIEWCDIWIPHSNEFNLPRVLLIGDSIVRAYRPEVEKRLSGKAYVAQLSSSAFVSDPVLLAQVAMVLDANKFDVILFNNGMHGWEHPEDEYARALPVLIATIRKHAPSAKLIWANTTPLRDDSSPAASDAPKDAASAESGRLMTQADVKKVSDARIRARNTLAEQIMKRNLIPINDLYSLSAGHPEHHSDNVHFNGTGINLQADQVADAIKKQLH
ncbi:MAG: SGNH/GDSL hydrolase family protein [Verrucomicrobiota bacterium]